MQQELPVGQGGHQGHQQLASPRGALAKWGPSHAEVSSLISEPTVGCAPVPRSRSGLDPVAKSFPQETLGEQGTGSKTNLDPLKPPNSLLRPFVLLQRFSNSLTHRQLLSKGYLVPISDAELCSELVPYRCATFTAAWADGPLPLNWPKAPTSCLHIPSVTTFQSMKGLRAQQESSVCLAVWRHTGWKCVWGRHYMMAASKSSSSGAAIFLKCFVGVIHPCLSHLPSCRFVRRLNINCDNAYRNFFVRCEVLGPSFYLRVRRASHSPNAQINLFLSCWSHPFSLIWQNLHLFLCFSTFSHWLPSSPQRINALQSCSSSLILWPYSFSLLQSQVSWMSCLYSWSPLPYPHISSWLTAIYSFLWNNPPKLPMTSFCR